MDRYSDSSSMSDQEGQLSPDARRGIAEHLQQQNESGITHNMRCIGCISFIFFMVLIVGGLTKS